MFKKLECRECGALGDILGGLAQPVWLLLAMTLRAIETHSNQWSTLRVVRDGTITSPLNQFCRRALI